MNSTTGDDEPIPRRDFILLPLVALVTAIVFCGLAEIAGGLMFADGGRFDCEIVEKEGFVRQKPNCVCWWKNPEGPMVEYRFNECGYRSAKPCSKKPPGTLRLVLIGTSIPMGLYVPNDQTFATRAESALNRLCSRPVEVQNLGSMSSLQFQTERIAEALKLSPDAVVLTVTPYDLVATGHTPQQPSTQKLSETFNSVLRQLELRLRHSKAVLAIAHFMLEDPEILFQDFSKIGSSREVMSLPVPAAGERRFAAFAAILDNIKAQLNGYTVPFIVMTAPNRVSAALLSNHAQIDGVDGSWFGRHIGEIAAERGALTLDLTPDFAGVPHAERLFFPVDNHPNGDASAVIAKALVNRLTDGSVAGWGACRPGLQANR